MLFNSSDSAVANKPRLWPARTVIFALISASTAAFLFCPCDLVSLRDHYAISLVGLAFLFAAAAAVLLYRQIARNSGITAFLRAGLTIAFVGISVIVELLLAMEVIAWLARPH